jgi:hypothetical protein
MSRVPITVMGFRCERCSHEWIPRGSGDEEPRVCPKCRSPWWNKPRKAMMPYDEFKERVVQAIEKAGQPLTWTEIRTAAGLPQLFPNNQWVHRLERDVGLHRHRGSNGIIHWELKKGAGVDLFGSQAAKASDQDGPSSGRK